MYNDFAWMVKIIKVANHPFLNELLDCSFLLSQGPLLVSKNSKDTYFGQVEVRQQSKLKLSMVKVPTSKRNV